MNVIVVDDESRLMEMNKKSLVGCEAGRESDANTQKINTIIGFLSIFVYLFGECLKTIMQSSA